MADCHLTIIAAACRAAQVPSGKGFLGPGIIFREGFNVRGLNTAATLRTAAAIGLPSRRDRKSVQGVSCVPMVRTGGRTAQPGKEKNRKNNYIWQ